MRKKDNITRYIPDINTGLLTEEIKLRIDTKNTNKINNKTSKSYFVIIFENLFTFFTILMFSITAFLLICKTIFNFDIPITKFTYLLPFSMNIIIGIVQQCRSKYILDKINIVSKSKYVAIRNSALVHINSEEIVADEIFKISAGQQVPADSIILSGNAEINESVLTGESDTVFKKCNDELLSGSYIVSGGVTCYAKNVGKNTYVAELQKRMKNINGNKSELMKNISSIVKMMSVVLVLVVILTTSSAIVKMFNHNNITWNDIVLGVSAAAIGCIPNGLVLLTSVTLAISVINLSKKKVLVQDLYALEHLSRVDTICLDKTGTLTTGTMSVNNIIRFNHKYDLNLYMGSFLASMTSSNQTNIALLNKFKINNKLKPIEVIPFSSERKMSLVKFSNDDICVLGAPDFVLEHDKMYDSYLDIVNKEANKGLRVLAFTINNELVAILTLSDDIRHNASKTVKYFYENNVDIKIISGDNPFTVSQIAKKCGIKNADKCINMQNIHDEDIDSIVDNFVVFGRITPEQKEKVIKALQRKGHKVAMTGDGVNDVLALKSADCSISFNSGTDSAKNISDVVLLNDSFESIPDVVLEGRKVVNNITRTSVLFLSKTIFIVLFTLFSMFISEGITVLNIENLYILEIGVIGFGGLLLSVEPNKNPITGTFKMNVYPKALVNGLFLTLAAATSVILYKTGVISTQNLSEAMIAILISISGITILYRVCKPITKYTLFVFLTVLTISVLLLLVFPDVFLNPHKVTSFEILINNIFNFKDSTFADFTQSMFVTIIVFTIVCLPIYTVVEIIINAFLAKRNNILTLAKQFNKIKKHK